MNLYRLIIILETLYLMPLMWGVRTQAWTSFLNTFVIPLFCTIDENNEEEIRNIAFSVACIVALPYLGVVLLHGYRYWEHGGVYNREVDEERRLMESTENEELKRLVTALTQKVETITLQNAELIRQLGLLSTDVGQVRQELGQARTEVEELRRSPPSSASLH